MNVNLSDSVRLSGKHFKVCTGVEPSVDHLTSCKVWTMVREGSVTLKEGRVLREWRHEPNTHLEASVGGKMGGRP